MNANLPAAVVAWTKKMDIVGPFILPTVGEAEKLCDADKRISRCEDYTIFQVDGKAVRLKFTVAQKLLATLPGSNGAPKQTHYPTVASYEDAIRIWIGRRLYDMPVQSLETVLESKKIRGAGGRAPAGATAPERDDSTDGTSATTGPEGTSSQGDQPQINEETTKSTPTASAAPARRGRPPSTVKAKKAPAKRERKAKVAAAPEAAKSGRRGGSIITFVDERLRAGDSLEKIAEKAKERFPKAKCVDRKAISWYRWKLKQLNA